MVPIIKGYWFALKIFKAAHLGPIVCGPPALQGLQWQQFGIRNIRSQDYSFPGTFVSMMELSFQGPFVPRNVRSRE